MHCLFFFVRLALPVIAVISITNSSFAQQKKTPASKPAVKSKTIGPAANSSSKTTGTACFDYLPLKDGSTFNYLEVTRAEGNNTYEAYKIEKMYRAAKPRVIDGIQCSAFLYNERKKPLKTKKEDELVDMLMEMEDPSEAGERIYYACHPELHSVITELAEIYETEAKLVGTYEEVEVETRGAAFWETGNRRTVDEYEYDRKGTGRFNANPIVGAGLETNFSIEREKETRTFNTLVNGEVINREKYIFRVLNKDTSLIVMGKSYNQVICSVDSVSENNELKTIDRYYYAKGVGLIRSVKTQLKSKTITRDLIPATLKTKEEIAAAIDVELYLITSLETQAIVENNKKIIAEKESRFEGTIDRDILGEWKYDVSGRPGIEIYRFRKDGTGERYSGARDKKPYSFTPFEWKVKTGFFGELVLKWLDSNGNQKDALQRFSLEKKYLRSTKKKLGFGIIYYDYVGPIG